MRDAEAVEAFETFNRQAAADADAVAIQRGGELVARRVLRHIHCTGGELCECRARIKTLRRDADHLVGLRLAMEEILKDEFLQIRQRRQFAQGRHVETGRFHHRPDRLPHFLVGRIVGGDVLRQARMRTRHFEFLFIGEHAQQGAKGFGTEGGRVGLVQRVDFRAGGLRRITVEFHQGLDHRLFDFFNRRLRQGDTLFLANDVGVECTDQRVDALGLEIEDAFELREINARRRAGQQGGERLRRIVVFEGGELRGPRRGVAEGGWRIRVDDGAAAERARRRLVAHDEAVAVQGCQWLIEDELHHRGFTRRDHRAAADRHPCGDIRSAQVHMHRGPVFECLRFAGEHLQARVDALGRRVYGGGHQPVAAADLRELDAREVDGATLTGCRLLRAAALFLHAAYAHFDAARREHQMVADGHRPRHYRASDNGAATRLGENAVDGVTQMAAGVFALLMRLGGG